MLIASIRILFKSSFANKIMVNSSMLNNFLIVVYQMYKLINVRRMRETGQLQPKIENRGLLKDFIYEQEILEQVEADRSFIKSSAINKKTQLDPLNEETLEEYNRLTSSKDFPALQNDRILKAERGEIPDKLPVWIMRQAGRYLPEFRELRKKHSFFEVCREPPLSCEATLMPIRRFDLDAAIIFSDILVVPQALGMTVIMGDKGPYFPEPLTIETLNTLNSDGAVDRLKYVQQAITYTRHKLNGKVPLFGFSGAPWTLMGYMIEGGGSKTLSKAKKWLYVHKIEAHQLLSLLTDVIIDYLVMQAEGGAQLLQVFDSSAEYLNSTLYKVYCLPYLKKIRTEVRNRLKLLDVGDVPMVLFAKGASFCLEEQAELGYEVLGIDWTVSPENIAIRDRKITLQGNLDPCALYAPKADLVAFTNDMIEKFGVQRYIVNLGHGIYPDMDPAAVATFVETVHNVKI